MGAKTNQKSATITQNKATESIVLLTSSAKGEPINGNMPAV
jgi:hypothetical protein